MLPHEIERMQNQLVRWGYTPRMVELMKPWSLLSHYESEKKKREKVNSDVIVSTYGRPVNEVKNDNQGKYKGIRY